MAVNGQVRFISKVSALGRKQTFTGVKIKHYVGSIEPHLVRILQCLIMPLSKPGEKVVHLKREAGSYLAIGQRLVYLCRYSEFRCQETDTHFCFDLMDRSRLE